jgi:transcriptional regulator with XRE-family HTH domain
MTAPPAAGPRSRRVGERVRRYRRWWGWSLVDLSARMTAVGCPMSASALSTIETGRRRVDVDDLYALARALGVEPALLEPGTLMSPPGSPEPHESPRDAGPS